jgi:hypothetical protein
MYQGMSGSRKRWSSCGLARTWPACIRWEKPVTKLAISAVVLLLAASIGHNARAEAEAPISIELNKLEPLPAPAASPNASAAPSAGCRVYLVVNNPDPEPIAQLRLDLVLFGTDEVIDRRIALDLAPLAPRKTSVRLFDLQGQPCDGIGRVLVNDVLACQFGKREGAAAEEPSQGCMDRLKLTSRTKAELTK